jgi:hypothetical protein
LPLAIKLALVGFELIWADGTVVETQMLQETLAGGGSKPNFFIIEFVDVHAVNRGENLALEEPFNDCKSLKFNSGCIVVGALFNSCLKKFHETEHTCPALQDTLFTALENEIFSRPLHFYNHHDHDDITHLGQAQTLIGWNQLFRIRFSCSWAAIQNTFLSTLVVDGQYFTGDLWLQKLINLLGKFNWSVWVAPNLD